MGVEKDLKKLKVVFIFFAKQKSKFSLLDFTKSRNRDRQRERDVIRGKRKSEIFAQFGFFCGQGTLKNSHFSFKIKARRFNSNGISSN